MKQTYEQRVQALAEKMAPQYFNNQNYPHTWDGGTLNDTHKHYWIGKCTPFARIAVAETVEEVKKALEHDYGPYEAVYGNLIHDYLKEQGFIPDQEPDKEPVIEHDPNGSTHNPATPEPDQKIPHNPCPEFPHFGASYPDARCIDGYLWDLDSYNDGSLTHGGDVPCPFCNTEAYKEYLTADFDTDEERERIIKHIDFLHQKYLQGKEASINE